MGVNIICVYNNIELLENSLINSLEQQDYKEWNFIPIDNRQMKYRGVMEAVRSNIERLTEKTTLIVHQDIVFENKNTLSLMIKALDNCESYGLVGVAGSPPPDGLKGQTISNIFQGNNHEYACQNQLNSPVECDTVDECAFFLQTSKIDEWAKIMVLKDSWHLYAVELSIISRLENKPVMVIPTYGVYHISPGKSLNINYYYSLRSLFLKYPEITCLNTPMGKWRRGIGLFVSYCYVSMKLRLKVIRDSHRKRYIG